VRGVKYIEFIFPLIPSPSPEGEESQLIEVQLALPNTTHGRKLSVCAVCAAVLFNHVVEPPLGECLAARRARHSQQPVRSRGSRRRAGKERVVFSASWARLMSAWVTGGRVLQAELVMSLGVTPDTAHAARRKTG